jgi:hypothetical protein
MASETQDRIAQLAYAIWQAEVNLTAGIARRAKLKRRTA